MDPFFTTKPQGKGTGLGLSMAYRTVQSHHGQMEIRSEPGQGTCVTLRFPVPAAPGDKPGPPEARHAYPPASALDVLLIDDDELIQVSVTALLESLGHRVTAARCGEEALLKVESGFSPDLAILDMNMPGLGGTGTLPRLLVLRPGLPVLLATGRVDQAALDLVKAFEGVTLLAKPFGLEQIQERLLQFPLRPF
jgi:CheY-like chemotaxis protein